MSINKNLELLFYTDKEEPFIFSIGNIEDISTTYNFSDAATLIIKKQE